MIIEKRPIAYKLASTPTPCEIIDSAGDALVINYYHSLSDGDVVYIKSTVSRYNGHKFVDVIDPASFKIRNTELGENIEFIQEIEAEYYNSILEHGWISVHQPIVYTISNDKYPVNDAYLTATVSAVTSNNGFARIVCSGNVSDDLKALDYVKIGAQVYQVKTAESDSIFTIDLVYSSSFAVSVIGETATLYYNNYHIVVRIFAGLNSGHPYAYLKPYTLLATKKFIPDANNQISFDISGVLRGAVTGINNLLGDTAPLNLDAFTQFFISVAESYDVSDGTDITTFTSTFEADSFEGYAIDSFMPFKSRDINTMGEYVASSSVTGKFLTLMEVPIYVPGFYFDLSFIKNDVGDFYIDVNGNIIYFPDKGPGVYRLPITESLLYSEDQLCIAVFAPETIIPPAPEPTVAAFSQEQQIGSGASWALLLTPTRYSVTPAAFQSSKLLAFEVFGGVEGAEYTIGYDVTFSNTASIIIYLYDDTLSQFVSDTEILGSGNHTGSVVLTPNFIPKYLAFRTGIGDGSTVQSVQPFTFDVDTGDPVVIPASQLVGEICIDVVDDLCLEPLDAGPGGSGGGGGGPCPPAVLLEGGGFILLE